MSIQADEVAFMKERLVDDANVAAYNLMTLRLAVGMRIVQWVFNMTNVLKVSISVTLTRIAKCDTFPLMP